MHRTFCMHTHFPIGKSGLDRNAPKHDRNAAHTSTLRTQALTDDAVKRWDHHDIDLYD